MDPLPPGTPVTQPAKETSTEVTKYVDKAMFAAEKVDEEALDRPRVYLLSATPDPLGAVAATAMMYEGRVVRDLSEITDDERRHYFDDCFNTTLKAPLEQIDFHFMVEGLTRATWDQMRTQRTANFAGESLRFAVKDNLHQATRSGPNIITGREKSLWNNAISDIERAYKGLIDSGVPAEDARGLLPMNVLVRGHYKTNLRNLETEIGKRLCTQAQFEWRALHGDLRRAIGEYKPTLGGHAGSHECQWVGSGWQFQYIANHPAIFKPVCFKTGQCMFKAQMDRGCTIRERVEKGEFDKIRTEEWADDPTAAWVR